MESFVMDRFSFMLGKYKAIQMVSKRTGKPYSVARLAGFNAATFDGPRIFNLFGKVNKFLPAHPRVLCVLQRAEWWFEEKGIARPSDMQLGTLCKYFNIDLSGAHDALIDVRGTIALMKVLRDESKTSRV